MAVVAAVVIIAIAIGIYYVMTSTTHVTTVSPTTSASSTTSPVASSSQNITLTIITFSGQSAQFIQYAGNEFHKLHPNIYVKVIQEPFSNYITVELTAMEAHSSQYDILGFTSTSALRVAPYLVNLAPYLSMFNMSDLISPQENFGGIYYNTTTGQEEYIGIVYETAVYLLAYNATLFNNSALANQFYSEYGVEFNPQTWQNWTTVLDVDKFLVNNGITKMGILIDDHAAHGIIDAYPAVYGWFYARNSTLNQGNIGGLPNFNIMFTGKPAPGCSYPLPSFNSTSGLQALEVYKQLVSYEPSPNVTVVEYDNLPNLYESGAPGAFLFSTQLSYLSPSVYNETLVAPLPGGYAETGTDFLGISKYSLHQQAAAEFLAFLVSPQMQEEAYLLYHKFPVSKTAIAALLSNSSIPIHDRLIIGGIYKAALNAWANPPNIPITYTELIPQFNSQVYNYLMGTESAQAALQQAAQSWANDLVQTYGACR